MSEIRRHYTDIKTVLRKQDLADLFTISRYGFSPYRACQHGCLYCDGRAEKYYVDGEFDKDIIIRRNLPEILQKEVGKIREKGFVCIGSGVSDPYQPVESNEKIVRKCAEILKEHSLPVVVMTKSSMVLRDLDLWAEVNRRSRFLLMVSLTFTDDRQRRLFEPFASSVEARLKTLYRFKQAGCFTGVLAMPFLAGISETRENMSSLALKIRQTGADFLMPGGLTLRPGVQKETFLCCIQKNYPELTQMYKEIYSEERASGNSSFLWREKTASLYQEIQSLSGLPSEIPHYVYRDIVPVYEEIYLLLAQLQILYKNHRSAIKRLEQAFHRYREWVVIQKKPVNRSPKRSYEEIAQLLRQVCRDGAISEILGNHKLAEFISEVVLNRSIFDSLQLKLVSALDIKNQQNSL